MTVIAGAIGLLPSLWVERLVDVAVPGKGSPQRSEEQLQARRAMPEGEASRPGRAPKPGMQLLVRGAGG